MGIPVLLAIETSQRTGGVALRGPDGRVHVERLHPSARHDDDLMPAIDRVFRGAGLLPRDLEAVGVSIGPGGFTGLRIAVATAKMLAMTLGAKVVAVPSALVVAESFEGSHPGGDGPILVALASKRETAWVARLGKKDGVWVIIECGLGRMDREGDMPRPELRGMAPGPGDSDMPRPAGIRGLRGMAPLTPGPGPSGDLRSGVVVDASSLDLTGVRALLADEYLPDSMRAKADAARVPIVEPVFDAAACLRVAARLLDAGQIIDPHLLAPLYPRPPEAVSLWVKARKRRSEG